MLKSIAKRILPLRAANALRRVIAPHKFDECEAVYRLMRQMGVRHGVMFDVGAHNGGASLPFAGDAWTVHAFEPDPRNAAHFRKNMARAKNVHLDIRAVSDVSGQDLPFFDSDVSSGISSLHSFDPSHRPVATVRTVALKDYIAENRIDRIDFLKTDVEGHDYFALKGMPFDRIQPTVIVTEYEENKTKPLGISNEDIANLLLEAGYKILVSEWEPIVQYGSNHKWRRICDSFADVNPASWGNIVAFRDVETKAAYTNLVAAG